VPLLWTYVRTELTLLWRLPAYVIPTLSFPVLLYVFFGLPFASGGNAALAVMASYAAYGVVGVAVFQFGVNIANERGSSWERFLRLLPAPFGIRMVSRSVAAGTVALITSTLVIFCAITFGHAKPTFASVACLLLVLVVGAIPFVLLGISLGYWAPPRAAVPIANLIYLPLSLAGGFWIPPAYLPSTIAKVSPYTPTRHYAELAWAAVLGTQFPVASLLWLFAYTLVFAFVGYVGYRREQSRSDA
jgi:ABC-2 type transport system permease protein